MKPDPPTPVEAGRLSRAAAAAAARLLWETRLSGQTVQALPPGLLPTDAANGHAIQALLPVVTGRAVVGWKIAATSAAGQAHIGVSGPLAGRVLSGLVDRDGDTVSLTGNVMKVAEPEFAFHVGRHLAPRQAPYTVPEVLDAMDALLPSIEVPNSRFEDFARAGEAQLIADDACAHRFAIGRPATADWRSLDLRAHRVRATVHGPDGAAHTQREGNGTAVLGDPRVALAWLVNEVSGLGVALEPGQFISTGTCMVPLPVRPGDRLEVDYGALGSLSLRFVG
jgi:2-keto-4-pentenoate hydratase